MSGNSQNQNFITAQKFGSGNPLYTGDITLLPTGSAYNQTGPGSNPITNMIINNTFRIPITQSGEVTPVATLLPYIELKDQMDGKFKKISINSNSIFLGNSELVQADDIQNIINEQQVIFSNVYIDAFTAGNSYINFLTNESNVNLPPQIGLRVSNGYIEYLHYGKNWAKVGSTTETFPTEMYLVTPDSAQKSVPVPIDCVGVRLKVVGGGGRGGNAAVGLFSQGAGGGSGGFVDCFLTEDDILNCANIDVNFHPAIGTRGANVSVYMKRPALPNIFICVANASGGFSGASVIAPPTSSIDGGAGGVGEYTYVTAKQGYVIPGGTGETGFWSEPQNLRYYSGGVGADSQLGTGGTGASTTAPSGLAYFGGGGGGGLFVPQGMFNPPTNTIPASNISYPGGLGGDPAVLIEFWVNAEPWNSNTGGGGGNASAYFRNLLDVSVSNISANKYLKYINQVAVNQTLDIVDDTTPQLGGNLTLNGYNLVFPNSTTGLVDASGNLAVAISNANTNTSYLVLKASELQNGEPAGEITVESQLGALEPDVSLAINSKGNGDIQMSAGNSGVIQLKGGQLSIDDTSLVEITSGHMTLASSYITDTQLATTTISLPYKCNAAITSSFLVIECSTSNKRYYIDLTDGAPGQILNVIYDSTASNTEVRLGFRDNDGPTPVLKEVGIGSGLVPALRFAISGQSSQLAYIDMQSNPGRSRWQVLNSGAFTST